MGYWKTGISRYVSNQLWLPTISLLNGVSNAKKKKSGLCTTMLKGTWFESDVFPNPQMATLTNGSLKDIRYTLDYHRHNITTCQRSRKVRIYPTTEQRKVLRSWTGAYRYVYNKTVERFNNSDAVFGEWSEIEAVIRDDLPEWFSEVPEFIKTEAIRNACIVIKQNICGSDKRNTRFRTKKDKKQLIYIDKEVMENDPIYKENIGDFKITEKGITINSGFYIVYHLGRWYLNYVVIIPAKTERQGRVVAIDPGVKTFLTFYSFNHCGKIGNGNFTRVYMLCKELDRVVYQLKRANHKLKYRLKKLIGRLRWRIMDLVDELHHKTTLFLVKNFDIIVIPKYNAKDMMKLYRSNVRSKVARKMMTFAHARFINFLQAKAKEYNKRIIFQNEAWTSKTCSWSGEIIANLANGSIISDGVITMDRDYNGARGIMVKAIQNQLISAPEYRKRNFK